MSCCKWYHVEKNCIYICYAHSPAHAGKETNALIDRQESKKEKFSYFYLVSYSHVLKKFPCFLQVYRKKTHDIIVEDCEILLGAV